MSQTPSKRLIIRLSSLGDVVLTTSALVAIPSGEIHWVISEEYSGLLKGHPRVARVWEFDRRKAGSLLDWIDFCALLWNQGYTEVLDLHCSWRSRIAKIYFLLRSKLEKRPLNWKSLPKERVQLRGLFLAKKFWPKCWYPTPVVVRAARVAGGSGSERPDLTHLIGKPEELSSRLRDWMASHPEGYVCVMPSSKWNGKKWRLRGFFEVIAESGFPAVVLGSGADRESRLLVKTFEQAGISYFDGVGTLSFRELATVLAGARAYLGNDTGLAHLSEAVGTPVVTIFGPTIPEMGFGPWRAESRAVGIQLSCKPCGKDGRRCYRFGDRYACQNKLPAGEVARELASVLASAEEGAGK